MSSIIFNSYILISNVFFHYYGRGITAMLYRAHPASVGKPTKILIKNKHNIALRG